MGFGYSTNVEGEGNNAILAFDERYNAWSKWLGVYPAIFEVFKNPLTKERKLYYGSSKDGNVHLSSTTLFSFLKNLISAFMPCYSNSCFLNSGERSRELNIYLFKSCCTVLFLCVNFEFF